MAAADEPGGIQNASVPPVSAREACRGRQGAGAVADTVASTPASAPPTWPGVTSPDQAYVRGVASVMARHHAGKGQARTRAIQHRHGRCGWLSASGGTW